VNHDGGYTAVQVDQTVKTPSGGFVLGTFYFSKGSYAVQLTDSANGRVVADSVRFRSVTGVKNTLQAEFGAGVLTGSVPLTVSFTDYSEQYSDAGASISSWFWDFGDGSTSTERYPRHDYLSSGVYTVSLTITDTAGAQDTEIKTGLIAVGRSAPLRAQFAAKSRIVTTSTPVEFVDMSSGSITSGLWDFGDGATSTKKNPSHTYTTAGTYPVTLTVSSSSGTDTKTNTGYVQSLGTSYYTSMADNVYHYKPHFYASGGSSGKTILYGNTAVSEGDLKYARMFYGSCNSCNYYAGTFHRGILYCTTSNSDLYTGLTYLKDYMSGKTDAQILQHLNAQQNIHEMINFNLKPPSLR
jgi:PKD repeat protein